ncbi:MAG: hypothetical protein A2Z97_16655, partial [Bdellovibrionales bacterium GWB1_52_6]
MNSEIKKIVIDGRMVTRVPHGFARYVWRLADGLRLVRAESRGLPYEPVFLVNATTDLKAFETFRMLEVSSDFLNFKELVEIPKILNAERAAAYHSPTFSSLLWAPCPSLVTVHDLNHRTYGGFKERLYYSRILKRFARNAVELLTVSEFSKQEIAAWLSVPESEIEVVPNALGPELFAKPAAERLASVLSRFGLHEGKYFFCLSNPKPHKNVRFLTEAYQKARSSPALDGAELWPLALSVHGIAQPGSPGIVELGSLMDDEALCLMYGAGALVFPSLYEGFGLPPVEAASIGTPIMVSDIVPHREGLCDLHADEAIWVGPNDLSGWIEALLRVGKPGQPLAPRVD